MSQVSLLSLLLPINIFPNTLHHHLLGLNGTQLEALHQEQVLELDLLTHQIKAAPAIKKAVACL